VAGKDGNEGDPTLTPGNDPRPLGGLADLADLLGGESDRSRRFLGGLIAGALVGAAVAGAALVRRRRDETDRPS
jgi:hypothetical protein